MTDPDDIIGSDVEVTPKALAALDRYNKAISKSLPHKAMVKRSYKFIDQWVEAVGLHESSPCKRGCSACCTHNTDITQVEAVTIAQHYQIPFKNIKEGEVVLTHKPSEFDGMMCPFNKDGECQVYDLRPIVCRTFFSQEPTPDPCFVVGGGGMQFNHRSSNIFGEISLMLGTGTNFQGGGDIRDFFGKDPIEVKK